MSDIEKPTSDIGKARPDIVFPISDIVKARCWTVFNIGLLHLSMRVYKKLHSTPFAAAVGAGRN